MQKFAQLITVVIVVFAVASKLLPLLLPVAFSRLSFWILFARQSTPKNTTHFMAYTLDLDAPAGGLPKPDRI